MKVILLRQLQNTPSERRTKQTLPENVREQTIRPFTGVRIEYTIQCFLAHGLGIDDMCHALNALKALQGLEQNAPGS